MNCRHAILATAAFSVALATVWAGSASGQDIPDFSGDFGNLISPEVESLEAIYPELVGRPGVTWRVRPQYTYSDGTDTGGLGLISEFGRFELEARALHIEPPEGDDPNDYRVRLKRQLALPASLSRFRLSVSGDYTEREGSWRQTNIAFSGKYYFDQDQTIAAAANVGYRRRDFDAKPTLSDATSGVGVEWKVSDKLSLGWDYTLENDVSKKDYTVVATLSQTAAFRGSLGLGLGRNSTAMLSYRHTFKS
jgi:hypothetical protein